MFFTVSGDLSSNSSHLIVPWFVSMTMIGFAARAVPALTIPSTTKQTATSFSDNMEGSPRRGRGVTRVSYGPGPEREKRRHQWRRHGHNNHLDENQGKQHLIHIPRGYSSISGSV